MLWCNSPFPQDSAIHVFNNWGQELLPWCSINYASFPYVPALRIRAALGCSGWFEQSNNDDDDDDNNNNNSNNNINNNNNNNNYNYYYYYYYYKNNKLIEQLKGKLASKNVIHGTRNLIDLCLEFSVGVCFSKKVAHQCFCSPFCLTSM